MERRYREHAAGSVKCKYTRSFPPTELSACWVVESDLSFAMKLEAAIKRLPKAEKTKLIKCSDDLSSLAVGQQDYRVVRYQLCD
jgi:putative endonuclease